MKKASRKTYLNEEEELLVIVSYKIKGGRGLPLDCCGVAQQLQNVVKTVKFRCDDCNIQEKLSMRYFQELIKSVNKEEDEHEDQEKIIVQG